MAAVDLIPVIAPELTDNPQLAGALVIAESRVAADHCQREQAVAYMAAHVLTIAGRGGAGGAVASETEGSLSRSFSTGSGDTGGLGSTAYGQEVQRLNRICYGMSARTGWPVTV